ncbi:MAG: hypothetical protein KAI24_09920, partial [Planctomycetes bacterium]|nr:hypothetical protein [Planctomycetota bacterium]
MLLCALLVAGYLIRLAWNVEVQDPRGPEVVVSSGGEAGSADVMMAGPSPDADADAAAASDDGRAQGREVSLPVREDVTSDLRDLIARAVPDLPDPDALIDAVSDELILKGDASLVLDSVFFQAIVPAPVREDPGYRRRVAEALAGLREHRRTLFTKRDEATSAG